MSKNCLLLFTKPARAGRVKTRMIGRWSAEQAAMLHAAFLADVVAGLLDGVRGGAFDLKIAWALDEIDPVPTEPQVDGSVAHVRQQGADLGERLWSGLADAAKQYPLVAAIGSDHPEIQASTVAAAFEQLSGPSAAEIVLGPAADGGYYLIALRAAVVDRALFDGVPWSSAEVLDETMTRARRLGLSVALLPEAHDVDDAQALEALVSRLERPGAAESPQTRKLLAAWGLMDDREVSS